MKTMYNTCIYSIAHFGKGGNRMRVEKTEEQNETQFVLYKENTPVGACVCTPLPGGARLERITIEPAWRRKGYGSYLLKQVLKTTGGYGKTSLHTAPAPTDPAARALLQKFGFAAVGEEWTRRRTADPTAVSLTHAFLRQSLAPGGFYIDATCGNGGDTEFLCRLAGSAGRVLALDVQQQAVEATGARLAAAGLDKIGRVMRADHADLAGLAARASADCVMFNFGYLPGADHSLFTTPKSSLPALRAALEVLKPGGVLAACLYSGGPNGNGEKQAVQTFFSSLPVQDYTVLICRFANWADTAPLPCFVIKKQKNET